MRLISTIQQMNVVSATSIHHVIKSTHAVPHNLKLQVVWIIGIQNSNQMPALIVGTIQNIGLIP